MVVKLRFILQCAVLNISEALQISFFVRAMKTKLLVEESLLGKVELVKIQWSLQCVSLSFLRYIPVKYEKLKEPTSDEPGLIRVHTIQEQENGTKEEVTEEFNTVCFPCVSILSDFLLIVRCISMVCK